MKEFKDKILIKQGKTYIDDDLLNLNKDLINTLIEQLKVKDIQIQELNNRLAVEQELTKNRQVLELRQPKDIKLLEEHFKDLDKNLLDLRERMEQRKETQQQIFSLVVVIYSNTTR